MEINPSSQSTFRLHVIVRGNVQGVGFRAMAQFLARQLDLGGSAQNLSDGSVELYVIGSIKKSNQFLDLLRQKYEGHITSISTSFSPFEGSLISFKIIL